MARFSIKLIDHLIEVKLAEDLNAIKPHLLIITGDGRTELRVIRGLCRKFNGPDIILGFPFSPKGRKSNVNALDAIKIYLDLFNISSFMFIADGDFFDENPFEKIENYLESIGISIIESRMIKNAQFLRAKSGVKDFILFNIISGPEVFIEEEVAILLNLKLQKAIDLTGNIDFKWKKRIKKEVKQILRHERIKLEELISNTGINKLEQAFPNFCAVFREIEKLFRSD